MFLLGADMAPKKTKKFDFLGGGLVTRPDDHYTDLLNDKGKLYSPATQNLQFTKIGSLQKRLGYELQGAPVTSTVTNQTTSNTNVNVTSTGSGTMYMGQKISYGSDTTVESCVWKFYVSVTDKSQITNIQCVIRSDSAGSPGAAVASSANVFIDAYELQTGSPATMFFYFPAPVTLTASTDYWFSVEATSGSSSSGAVLGFGGNGSAGGTVKYGMFSSLASTGSWLPYLVIRNGALATQGIYDYRVNSSGTLTQFPMVAANGVLYYYNAGYTSIKSGLATSVNALFDFATLKNYLFSCDYANNNNQVWDGSAAATMTHGYRGTFSIANSASAGGPWSAAGVVKVMLVTQLVSGGYRCSAVGSTTLGATTNKIDLTSIAVDSVAAQFSFDISSLATTVYCTLPNGSIFYKVPAAYMSAGGINPIANNDTTESILPMTDAQLTAGGSFELNLGYPQGYATGQVATPKAKFFDVFQNMLVSAGDPNNPSRVWFSEQFAPQVWGDGSSGTGIQGDYLDIAISDGETITGLMVSDGALMVGKQSNIYRVDYTGNATDSWIVNKVHGQVGVLSNWSMQIIPQGMFFLSSRGPAICYGTYSDVLPQTRLIQNLFSNTDSDRFNLASMIYAVACNDVTNNQILMTVSSTDSTVRDRILSYDYEQNMFALFDGFVANYIAIIGDSNGFPVLWHGNLSAQIFKRYTAYYDNTAPILVRHSTPNMDLGAPSEYKQVSFLQVGGKTISAAANLIIDVFVDESTTIYRTLTLDTTATEFSTGLMVNLGIVCKSIKLRFRNVDYNGNGLELNWLRLEYSDASGTRYG